MISVIVPVYNVEKYVGKCIESILQQTYTDFELILVNDGSTDKSGEICSKYSKIDKRIKLINQANGGLSSARNVGIDVCAGDYITFIDSDDYISKCMLQELYECLSDAVADIAMCSFKRVKENDVVTEKIESINPELIDSKECFRRIYTAKADEFTVAWGKLYKKELFKGLRYPEGKIHEDEFVTYKLFAQAEKIVYLDVALYYYLIREQSIMHAAFSRKSLVRLEAYSERINYFENIGESKLAAMAAQRFIDKSAEYYTLMRDNDKNDIRTQAINLYNKYYMSFKCETLREKIIIKTFVKCLGAFWIYYYIIRFGIAVKRYLKT